VSVSDLAWTSRKNAMLRGRISRSGRALFTVYMKTKKSVSVRRGRATRRSDILIVDNMTAVRAAVSNWINRFPDLKVCGQAVGPQTAYDKVNKLHPRLVLTELLRPRDLSFVRELHRRHPRLPILVFSHHEEEAYASRALAVGARGYLMKGVDGDALVAGIRSALKGNVVLSHTMAMRLDRNGNSH
jgi:DNA-binding NarL/FixJ family response regulator